jgi:hypothetical protein
MTLRDPDVEAVLVAMVDDADLVPSGAYSKVGGVYFVRCEAFIKIGIAGSVLRRFEHLQTASPFQLEGLGFIACASGADAVRREAILHTQFAGHRVRGEWFNDVPSIRAYVAADAAPWPGR